MSRNELTLAIAATLIAAVLIGWVLRWLFERINATGSQDAVLRARLAEDLQRSEAGREAAEAQLAKVEAEFGERHGQALQALDTSRQELARVEAEAAAR